MVKTRKSMPIRPTPEGESSDTSEKQTSQKPSFKSLVISRLEEKEELQHLNDRFAQYIEYLHKSIFGKEFRCHIDLLTESLKDKLNDYAEGFANEVELLRQNLDKSSLESANAKIQLKTATSELEETVKQLKRSKAKETDLNSKVASLTNQLSKLQSELADCIHYKTDYDSLMEQQKMLKSQLENETLLHTDTKNKLLTALKQLEFKDQLLDKERNIWNNESIQLHLTSIIKKAENNYHDKLQDLLYDLRSQMEIQYNEARIKVEEGLKANLDAEKLRSNMLERDLMNKVKECQRLLSLLSSHTNDLSNCQDELEAANKQIQSLEQRLQVNEDKMHRIASQHRGEIERLLNLLADKSAECTELSGIKIQLDAEIAMYRKLLECEESRLDISPDKKMTGKPIIRISTGKKRSYEKLSSSILTESHPSTSSSANVDLDAVVDLSKSVVVTTENSSTCRRPLTTTSIFPRHSSRSTYSTIAKETMDSTDTLHLRAEILESMDNNFNLEKNNLSTSSSSLVGNSLRITCRSDGPIHFASADPGDGLVRIYNASENAIDLGDWRLYSGPTHEGSLDYAKLYTFPKSQILQPHTELQIFLCWAAEPSQVSASKRSRHQVTAVLHLITPISVWNPYSSLIALQDSVGSVRATCEMEPCSEKYLRTSKVSHSITDTHRSGDTSTVLIGSDDKTSSAFHQEVSTQDEDQNRSIPRTSIGHGDYFDFPQRRLSSLGFRNTIWPCETGLTGNGSSAFTCTLLHQPIKFLNQNSDRNREFNFPKSPSQEDHKRKISSSENDNDTDLPSKILCSDENKLPNDISSSPSLTLNKTSSKLLSGNNPLWPIGNMKKMVNKISEVDTITMNKMIAECRRKLSSRSNKNVLQLIQGISNEWFVILLQQIESDKFQQLANFIAKEQSSGVTIYPPIEQIFSWTKLCLPEDIRVVILGQDPYHGPKQAHGLAFSVCRPVPAPPSLVNMYKEISSSMNLVDCENWPPKHGDLTGWAKQGVLLLNAVLTVRASAPNSHKDKGWEFLTDAAIRYLNKKRSNLVFMLWGANAQKQGQSIDHNRHLVLNAPHPSPLSANRGFFGCDHFVKANEYLKQHKIQPIDWMKLD
ncbi:unnamed protein product [Heterobilharzia americana]|nr:unnamed protein product [Heterobilharzia americana]